MGFVSVKRTSVGMSTKLTANGLQRTLRLGERYKKYTVT